MPTASSLSAIGRTVIAELEAMSIAPAPECYEVWFKYRQNVSPEITAAIDTRRAAGQPVDSDFIFDLHKQHCEIADLGPAFHRYFDRVIGEVEDLQGVAHSLADSAREFGDDVETLADDMNKGPVTETHLRKMLAALVETAANAKRRNHELEQKLTAAVDNVCKLRASIEEIEQDAHTDFLTKLANRRRFDKFMRETLANAEVESAPVSLIVCDIDHFKKFNDSFGHQVGDQVLKFVADILKKNTKGQDLAARFGGEEFAIVLPNTGAWNAKRVAEHIRTTIAKKKLVNKAGNQDLGTITMSFGVAEREPGMTVQALVEIADSALYEAKRGGRNRVVVSEQAQLRTA